MKQLISTCLLIFSCAYWAFAQCSFDPTVLGNTLICPNDTSILSTQTYDAYQWYKRNFGADTAFPISGATDQELSVTFADDTPAYFSVEVTQAGCTERSPELLVDGLVFLLPTVTTEGDFEVGSNGEALACEGDSILLILNTPYDTLITWQRNGMDIPGETSNTLIVTMSGDYTVSGAPLECPGYIQPLGVIITIIFSDCMTDVDDPFRSSPLKIYPNPAAELLYFSGDELGRIEQITLYSIDGQRLSMPALTLGEGPLNIAHLPAGTYVLQYQIDGKNYQQKFVK